MTDAATPLRAEKAENQPAQQQAAQGLHGAIQDAYGPGSLRGQSNNYDSFASNASNNPGSEQRPFAIYAANSQPELAINYGPVLQTAASNERFTQPVLPNLEIIMNETFEKSFGENLNKEIASLVPAAFEGAKLGVSGAALGAAHLAHELYDIGADATASYFGDNSKIDYSQKLYQDLVRITNDPLAQGINHFPDLVATKGVVGAAEQLATEFGGMGLDYLHSSAAEQVKTIAALKSQELLIGGAAQGLGKVDELAAPGKLDFGDIWKQFKDEFSPTECAQESSTIRCAESMEKSPREGTIARGFEASEEFKAEIEKIRATLSPRAEQILQDAEIKPVHNLAAELGVGNVDTLGAWILNGKKFYVAEHTGFLEDLRVNNDVDHAFRHELGHKISDSFGELNRPASDFKRFIHAYKRDLEKNNPYVASALAKMSESYNTVNEYRHEVFADTYAHTTGSGSNNGYSQLLKSAFPEFLREMKKFVEEYHL